MHPESEPKREDGHMSRLWVRIMKDHKIREDIAVPCAWGEQEQALRQAAAALEAPVPLWLGKHQREFESFRHTVFLPDHFVEAVDFHRMEIEYLDDSGKKRRNSDPRNQF
jgi:hypothetical protein